MGTQAAPRVAAFVLSLLAASCRSRAHSDPVADGSAKSAAKTSPPRPQLSRSGSGPLDSLGSVYPREVKPHPLAAKLCDALHAFPGRRRAECCGGQRVQSLAAECTRVLSASLDANTVELDEGAVRRCESAMHDALAGCDWVTPTPPLAPDVCLGLATGKLPVGSVCRSSLECEGAAHCDGVSPTKTGICRPPGSAGAACGAHVDVLATYLLERHLALSHPFCSEFCSLVLHQCAPLPRAGSACFANVDCAPAHLCASGRCSASGPAREGQSCSAVPCEPGLRCVAKVCTPLANTGEACAADEDCSVGGCVESSDGRGACGAKCALSLDVLRGREGGVTMGLPIVPRRTDLEQR